MLNRAQQPDPRGDDRERITRARQAAEALFASKLPMSGPSVPDTPSADQSARKPRILRVISPIAPVLRHEQPETPIATEPRTSRTIPREDFARIRTWLKYGMTARQAAQIYGVPVGEVERALRDA